MLFAHIGTKLYSNVSKAQEARDRAPPILQASCLQHHTLKLDLKGGEYDNNIARGTPGTVSVTPKQQWKMVTATYIALGLTHAGQQGEWHTQLY